MKKDKKLKSKGKSRTWNIYRHQCERASVAGEAIDYDLSKLRDLVALKIQSPCKYCQGSMTADNFSIDHMTPVERGGAFTIDNVQVICMRCNQIKGNMDHLEYQRLIELIQEFHPKAEDSIFRRLRAGGRIIFSRGK